MSDNQKRIIISGGSGFIGKTLIEELLKLDYKIILLSRKQSKTINGSIVQVIFNPDKPENTTEYFENSLAVINLAGESIGNKRWTEKQKKIIYHSRINITKAIVKSISLVKNKPELLINASAVGYYGNNSNAEITESFPKGSGFLSDVCGEWEKEALYALSSGVRVALLRFGIVLDKDGGSLKKMILPYRFFAGGSIGNGKQWISWIHKKDLIKAIIFILNRKELSGAVNITSPNPVRMKEFSKALGKVLHKPSFFHVPSFALKLLLGEMSEIILTGQKVLPKKLLDSGFKFDYPELEESLRQIFR